MAARISAFLKNAWANQPVLVVSFSIWGLAIIMPIISPYTKYSGMINRATPYVYPGPRSADLSGSPFYFTVPVRDNGNMPDVPSHPQDPQGPSLEWLKNL
uniref:NADH dehydrogenase [ubiquinone] 1 alpha subcomplex subunit 3 n=1 Tax=Peromyscus maniculatus bairdii TaxID=230844 RepID=A0A8C8TM68_PERMB